MTAIPGSKFERGSVEVFGYRIPFAQAGSGDVVVSLPGSAGLEMSTAKDVLAESHRVIELDPPGWGETPEIAGEMQQRHLAIILAEAVAELGIDRYHLVGTSLGGNNSLWLASQFPERVATMTLEGPMLFCPPEDLVNPFDIVAAVKGGMSYDENAMPAPPTHPNKPWSTPEFHHEQMRRRFRMMKYLAHPEDDGPLREFARSTDIPTMLLLGTADELLKESYAQTFAEVMPSATIRVIPGAGHDIQNTAPEAFVEAVSGLIA